MKKYRLKDRAMQEALDEMTGGEFSDGLDYWASATHPEDDVFVPLRVHQCLIELVPAYDPNAWNNYPDVMPPEGVLMRCEHDDGDTYCFAAKYDGGEWFDIYGTEVPVNRFRPWDEENEK